MGDLDSTCSSQQPAPPLSLAGRWLVQATRSSSSLAPPRTLVFFVRLASPSCTPVPTASSRESSMPLMRSWEAWSVTIVLRHQAGGREVSWQETTGSPGSTWTSSSSAAAPPVSDRMEAVWHKCCIFVAFLHNCTLLSIRDGAVWFGGG